MIARVFAWMALTACCFGAQSTAFQGRVETLVSAYAHPKGAGQPGYATISARLRLHEDPEWCSRRLQELLADGPTGDMFWMYPVISIAYLDKGQLSAPARKALRNAWKTYMPYRGDTENHLLLYYSSLYLAAQMWPNEGGEEWFTGKSSEENLEEARRYIEGWVRLTTTRGQGEYDSPHYMGVYLVPMSNLAAWATDPAMKKRAAMMLDYLIADYAPENLGGLSIGAHSRVYDDQLLQKAKGVSSDFGWLWFGLGHPTDPPGNYAYHYAVASAYEPPEILQKIATDRSQPYTHYERKRTRNRWRYHDELNGPVYKTTYVRREYAVASDQGGVLQPIQQHSWGVTWAVPDPRGVQNTFFTLNPHSSLHELQTYFLFSPDAGTEAVVRSKKSYDSPDKLLGGSPYEKLMQDQDALIALYDIPADARFPHINGFFSKDLNEVQEDASGWIFLRGGEALIACRPLQPYTWKPIEGGGKRLFSAARQNGMVVQVAGAGEFANMEAFRRAILALPLQFQLTPTPSVSFTSLRGSKLAFTYGETPTVNGKPLDYANWPLFGGPFVQADVDSQKLSIRYKTMQRTLDFTNLTVTDRR